VSFCAANTRAGKTERMFDPPGFALLGSTRAFDALTFFAGLPKVQHRHSIVIAELRTPGSALHHRVCGRWRRSCAPC
jgi:hypothetical protein